MNAENIIKPSELSQVQPYTPQLKECLANETDKPLDIIAQKFAEKHGLKGEVVKKYCKLLLIANNNKVENNENVTSPLNREPRLGDIFEIEIQDVRSYGFMVTTAHGYKGLVHISEIAEEFIDFPEDYGQIGDKYYARVICIEEKGLSLSFKALGGLKPVYRYKEILKPDTQPDKIYENAAKVATTRLQDEGKKIINLVSDALGCKVSIRAENEFHRLIRKYGLVDVTLNLQETIRNLDNGVLIAKIIENKINGADLEYIPSPHSMDSYIERVEPDISKMEAEQAIIYKCKNGKILFDNGLIRIIQHGDLAFPCVSGLNGWTVKTTLFYRMIINKTIDQLTKEYY